MTKKSTKFEWTKECQAAFKLLREFLTTVPVVAFPDMNKPFVLYTDASDGHIGVCLTQIHNEDNNNSTAEQYIKPIYYLSQNPRLMGLKLRK